MATPYQHDESEDEFESADEGEPTPSSPPPPPIIPRKIPSPVPEPTSSPPPSKPVEVRVPEIPPPPPTSPPKDEPVQSVTLPAVSDGWGDWNIDDDPLIAVEPSEPSGLRPQDSVSSLSSSPSKTGDDSVSQAASDEDEQVESSNQQRLQKKKFRKKPLESPVTKDDSRVSTRASRPTERRDEEAKAIPVTTATTKHDVKDAHHVLDRLAAQSPTRPVC